MVRTAAYLSEFREILKSSEIEANLKKESDKINYPRSKNAPVIKEIVEKLFLKGFNVNENTIYGRIKQSKSFSALIGQENVQKHVNIHSDRNKQCGPSITYDFALTENEYQDILPVSTRKNGRKRIYPRSGWTDTVQTILTKELKCPCAFRFKYISLSNVYCSAECSECHMLLHTKLSFNQNSSHLMSVQVRVQPDSTKLHQKARQVRGAQRDIDSKRSAFDHFNEKKLENSNSNVNNPSLNVYQKILSEKRIQERMEIQAYLEKMYDKNDDERLVRFQSLQPVSIVLLSKEQILAVRNERNYRILSIDETQGLVKQPKTSQNEKNQPIGIFTLMLQRGNKTALPVGQFLTSSRKSHTIQGFLNIWRDNVGVQYKIHEVVLDQDFAEAEATCISFNGFNLKTYNKLAYEFITNSSKKFNNTLIRFDRNHLTKTFATNTKKIKADKVFNQTLCYLIDESDIEVVITAIGCLLVLSLSPLWLSLSGASLKYLKNYSKSSKPIMEKPLRLEELDENWFCRIREIADESIQNEISEAEDQLELNLLQNKDMVKILERYSSRILMWTAVIPKFLKSKKLEASSAVNENFHRIMKTSVFKDIELPCEMKTYISRMEKTFAAMALPQKKNATASILTLNLNMQSSEKDQNSSLLNQSTITSETSIQEPALNVSTVSSTNNLSGVNDLSLFESESVFNEHPRAETNFMGCNPAQKKKKFSYLRRNPQLSSYSKVLVLKNRWEGTVNGKKIVITRVDSLNAFINMIAFAYEQSAQYRLDLSEEDSPWVTICEEILTEKDLKQSHQQIGQLYLRILENMKNVSIDSHGYLLDGSFEMKTLISKKFIDCWKSFDLTNFDETRINTNGTAFNQIQKGLKDLQDEGSDSKLILFVNSNEEERFEMCVPEDSNGYVLSGAISRLKVKNVYKFIFYGRLKDGQWVKFDEKLTKITNPEKLSFKLLLYLKE